MQYWVGYFLEDFYPFRKGDGINISSIEQLSFDSTLTIHGFYEKVTVIFDIPSKLIDISQEEKYYEN